MHDPDAELVHALRAGDEAAFVTLVGRYQPRLLRLATTMVPSRAVAEEVVQETWLGVVRGIEGFEGRSSVKTWPFRILVNRARTAGAKEPRSASLPAEDGGDPDVEGARFGADGAWREPPARWSDEVDDRLVADALAAIVREHLHELPAAQRQVLVLRDIEGLDAPETCALLGLSDGNQRVLLHRARQRLRSILEAEVGRR